MLRSPVRAGPRRWWCRWGRAGRGSGRGRRAEVAAGFGHSSCCSARTAPTRRMMLPRSGKMPTTSVRRRISLLRLSLGLLDQSVARSPWGSRGRRGCRRAPGRGARRQRAASREGVEHLVVLGVDGVGVGLVVTRCGACLTAPQEFLGTRTSGGRIVGTALCQVAPGRFAAIASTRPACASEVTSMTPCRPRATRSAKNTFHASRVRWWRPGTPITSRKPSCSRRSRPHDSVHDPAVSRGPSSSTRPPR